MNLLFLRLYSMTMRKKAFLLILKVHFFAQTLYGVKLIHPFPCSLPNRFLAFLKMEIGVKKLFVHTWSPCSLPNRYIAFLKWSVGGKRTYSFIPGLPASYLTDT